MLVLVGTNDPTCGVWVVVQWRAFFLRGVNLLQDVETLSTKGIIGSIDLERTFFLEER